MILKRAFLLNFIFFYALFTFGQSVNLNFEGTISDEKSRIIGATILVSQGPKEFLKTSSDATGSYAFSLPLGAQYLVTISKDGYISKKYSVNTLGVPPEKSTKKFPNILASLTLLKPLTGVDYSLLKQPLNKYYYNPEKDNFEYDKAYLEQMLAGLEAIKEAEKDIKNAEKEKEGNYLSALKQADKAYSKREWQTAISGYQSASVLKPGEAYPKDQIILINKAIADEQAKIKAEKEAADKLVKEKAAADAAAKTKAEKEIADKLAKEKAAADAAAKAKSDKELADKLAKEKAAADAAAKAKAEKESADKLAKEKADAEAKIKAEKEAADKLVKEKSAADAAAKAKIEKETADKLAKEKADAEAKSKAEKETADKLAKEKADAEAKRKLEKEAADKLVREKTEVDAKLKAAEDAAAKAKLEKEITDKLAKDKELADKKAKEKMDAQNQIFETRFNEIIKKADDYFNLKDYVRAKKTYEEALIIKGGNEYAKSKLVECEKLINSDSNQGNERINELLSKYKQGVTEEVIPSSNVVVYRRIVVKDKMAWVYEKKVFSWGGVTYYRDGSPVAMSVYEQETKQ